MRKTTYLVCFLIALGNTYSQQKKYLVSPDQEVITMGKRSSNEIISKYRTGRSGLTPNQCSLSHPMSEFNPTLYPTDVSFHFYHKQVCGQWYVMPADGTIDTVYYNVLNQVGPTCPQYIDCNYSNILVRIFSSNIGPTQGPGIRHGPYRPPCTSWGYYVNTSDTENGVAAFREDATPPDDRSWVPTNTPPSGSDPVASFPPFGNSIWGLEGFPVSNQPNTTTKVVLSDLAPLNVHKGDVIFISLTVPSPLSGGQDIPLEIGASDVNAPYPSRTWKFYEHDSGVSNCAGIQLDWEKRGWFALGPFCMDTLCTTVYNIWYSMTATSNTPPVISQVDQIHTTLSTGPQRFTCTIYDCDVQDTLSAGVKNAWVEYTLDSVTTHSIWDKDMLTYDGVDQYEYTLPGMNPTRTMYYKVVAEDSAGAADSSGIYSYKVVTLESTDWYRIDTISSCAAAKLTPGGTAIDTSQWFIAQRSFAGSTKPHRGDDGTAGPFPISGGFVFYGDTMHYAWVGVNGAIALSKTATDTIDLNAGGFWTDNWDFPYTQHHNRSDTIHEQYIPKAFIAPYWADWINKLDSPLATFGHVRYLDDTRKFVVEWDTLNSIKFASGIGDIEVFRAVLNKTDYSIEFQYDDIGYGGFDTLNLTGIQCDSNYHPQPAGEFPPYAFFNKDGYPAETHLHNGLCVHYNPVTFIIATTDGWNLMSLPTVSQYHSISFLFPCSIGPAYIFECDAGYTPTWTVDTGQGFWLKFSGACASPMIGHPITHGAFIICAGWNMIGSIGVPVPVSSITADPATGIGPSSTFFGYSGGYFATSVIQPGYAYFVRARGAGQIHLKGSNIPKTGNQYAELGMLNKITISQNETIGSQTLYIGSGPVDADKYQMPPAALEGAPDIRFASNRMVEIYPSVLVENKKYEYPILVNASQYPLTIRWEQAKNSDQKVTLTLKTEDGKVLVTINGSGKITLNDASVKKLIVAVNAGIAIPKVFALDRNYPNPFNPLTIINYQIPVDSKVRLTVYNILGQQVATIFDGVLSAGYESSEWNAGIYASGIYFYRLEATSVANPSKTFTSVKKMVLIK